MTLLLSLLKSYYREVALFALAAALAAGWHVYRVSLIDRGVALERARVADSTLAVLRPQLAHRDTVLVHDTARVTRLLSRVETDTAWRHDTLTVTRDTGRVVVVQVPIVVQAAEDSALSACRSLVSSCTLYRQTASAEIATLTARLAVGVPAPRCTAPAVTAGLLGAALGIVAGRIR